MHPDGHSFTPVPWLQAIEFFEDDVQGYEDGTRFLSKNRERTRTGAGKNRRIP